MAIDHTQSDGQLLLLGSHLRFTTLGDENRNASSMDAEECH